MPYIVDDACQVACTSLEKDAGSELILDSDELVQHRMMHKILAQMVLTYKGTHKNLMAQLEAAVLEYGEMVFKGEFLEQMHTILQELCRSLRRLEHELTSSPHPVMYPPPCLGDEGFALLVSECMKYGAGFRFSDVLLSLCRHSYHPFCAMMHFRESNHCALWQCGENADTRMVKELWFP